MDEYSSTNSSSTSGIKTDLSITNTPKDVLGTITVSQGLSNGTISGVTNVNSIFDVGGTHKVEAGEKVIYSGANVEADRVEIKGKEVIIASVKDTEKSESKNSNGSIPFNPTGVPKELELGYREGNGEKEWVSNQTSIIAKNGGVIESKDFTNSGSIIGSESAENKLTVKAENITVEHLKDKDTNKVTGGGIDITGAGVPGISIVAGGQDKRQDTNATAINTDFEIGGEKKTSEELGLNTDLAKAQEITKDKDRVLDADLHTELLNKSERDKIATAGQKIGDIVDAVTDTNSGGIFNTYKENRYSNLFNESAARQTDLLNILGDETVTNEGKIAALNELNNRFLKERGYEGTPPVIMIGEKTSAVDSGSIIFISEEHLNSPDLISKLAHESGHLNTYDTDEKTAKNMESKVDVLIGKSEMTESDRDKLESLKKEYAFLGSQKDQIEFDKSIPDEYKEFDGGLSAAIIISTVAAVNGYLVGEDTRKKIEENDAKKGVETDPLEKNLRIIGGNLLGATVGLGAAYSNLTGPQGAASVGILNRGASSIAAGDSPLETIKDSLNPIKIGVDATLGKIAEKMAPVIEDGLEAGARYGSKILNATKDKLGLTSKVPQSSVSNSTFYYRVQGGEIPKASQVRIISDENGKLLIPNKDANLNISAGSREHAEYFLNNRGKGAEIVEVEVPKWFDDFIEKNAIPQKNYKMNPLNQGGTAPKVVDPTTPGKSYELPSPWIEWLEEYGKIK